MDRRWGRRPDVRGPRAEDRSGPCPRTPGSCPRGPAAWEPPTSWTPRPSNTHTRRRCALKMFKSAKQRGPVKARSPLVRQRGPSLRWAAPSTWRHVAPPGAAGLPRQTAHGGRPPVLTRRGRARSHSGAPGGSGCGLRDSQSWRPEEREPICTLTEWRGEAGGRPAPRGCEVTDASQCRTCDQASAVTVTPAHGDRHTRPEHPVGRRARILSLCVVGSGSPSRRDRRLTPKPRTPGHAGRELRLCKHVDVAAAQKPCSSGTCRYQSRVSGFERAA